MLLFLTGTPVLKYFQKIEFAIRCESVKTGVTSQDFDLLPGEGVARRAR